MQPTTDEPTNGWTHTYHIKTKRSEWEGKFFDFQENSLFSALGAAIAVETLAKHLRIVLAHDSAQITRKTITNKYEKYAEKSHRNEISQTRVENVAFDVRRHRNFPSNKCSAIAVSLFLC